jgi:hypothetical protein
MRMAVCWRGEEEVVTPRPVRTATVWLYVCQLCVCGAVAPKLSGEELITVGTCGVSVVLHPAACSRLADHGKQWRDAWAKERQPPSGGGSAESQAVCGC